MYKNKLINKSIIMLHKKQVLLFMFDVTIIIIIIIKQINVKYREKNYITL